ncbi:hypothetical protein Q7P37_007663 [Cladosporium fusiforme]
MHLPTQLICLTLAAIALFGVWGLFAVDGGFDELDDIVARHPSTGLPGLQQYPGLDRGLMSIVAFNLCAVNSAAYRYMVQFLANVAVIPVVLSTEHSRAEKGSWAAFSTTWGLLSQLCTSAFMCPLYALGFIHQSSGQSASSPRFSSSRIYALSVAIGYGVPAALTLNVFNLQLKYQIWGILAFTVYPICILLTSQILSRLPGSLRALHHSHPPKWRYILAGTVGCLGHLWYMSSPEPAISDNGTRLVLRFLKIDYAVTFAAMLVLVWYELTSKGVMSGKGAAGGLAISWVVLGPGAMIAMGWALRERRLAWSKKA